MVLPDNQIPAPGVVVGAELAPVDVLIDPAWTVSFPNARATRSPPNNVKVTLGPRRVAGAQTPGSFMLGHGVDYAQDILWEIRPSCY